MPQRSTIRIPSYLLNDNEIRGFIARIREVNAASDIGADTRDGDAIRDLEGELTFRGNANVDPRRQKDAFLSILGDITTLRQAQGLDSISTYGIGRLADLCGFEWDEHPEGGIVVKFDEGEFRC